jgi:hypothetical protein
MISTKQAVLRMPTTRRHKNHDFKLDYLCKVMIFPSPIMTASSQRTLVCLFAQTLGEIIANFRRTIIHIRQAY